MYRHENLASILELDEQLNEYFNMFEDAPKSQDKKIPKERDAYNFTAEKSSRRD